MKTTTLILLCVTVFGVGLAHSPGGLYEKCLCRGKLLQSIRRKQQIKEIMVFSKSVFCGKKEIIAIMKNGKKKCLDPEGKQMKSVELQQKMAKKGNGRRNQ
uniref:Chemokine interleukin-8-like domain-containing protein n=1 Tax=Esox lucius TaxID=8010 RepID=A0A3P8ZAD3_ESOLU